LRIVGVQCRAPEGNLAVSYFDVEVADNTLGTASAECVASQLGTCANCASVALCREYCRLKVFVDVLLERASQCRLPNAVWLTRAILANCVVADQTHHAVEVALVTGIHDLLENSDRIDLGDHHRLHQAPDCGGDRNRTS